MTGAVAGAALGGLAGGGLLVALAASPPLRRPRLDDRLGPYLRDTVPPSRLLDQPRPVAPFPVAARLLAPVVADAVRLLDRAVGGAGSVRRRLEQAGRPGTVEDFRAEQVVWGGGGLLTGLALAVLVAARGAGGALVVLVLVALGGLAGVLARDRRLTREVQRRESRMLAEFPTLAEMLALSIAAGEGPVAALERLGRLGTGELPGEIDRVLDDVRAGAPVTVALEGLAARTTLPPLVRFVDGMVVALERGTPLADVLRAQAADAREAQKRSLLETGGRKEVAMLLPVVFLLLPVTLLFLVYPGFYGLSFAVR